LVAKSPRKREWLPQQTEAILSINTGQFERDDLPKRWHKDQPDLWQNVWNGLIGPAAHVPTLNLSRNTLRITRAATTSDIGTVREFILIENQSDVSQIIRSVQSDKEFHKRTVSGLAVWEKPDLALARVGPSTLAVGSSTEVDELVRVRLGIDLDLKITGQLFDRFEALDRGSALRLISRSPPDLPRMFHPIFAPEFLENSQLLGLALPLQNPTLPAPLLAIDRRGDLRLLCRLNVAPSEPHNHVHCRDVDLAHISSSQSATGRHCHGRSDHRDRSALRD